MRKLALAAALLCCSGAAFADPSGTKWFTTTAIPYKVFAHSSITGVSNFSTTALPAVQSGFSRWAAPTCTRWQISYQGTFSSPSGLAALGSDNQNRVIWLGGANWQHGNQTLGITHTVYYTSNGQIIDGDMELNNNLTWKVGGAATNQVDVESIITHEAGHFLGLNHSTPTSAVMYAYYNSNAGELKRTLTTTDINDVCTVYPASTTAGSQGDPCTQDAQCGTAAPACRGAVGGQGMICTKTCTSNSQCPTGYTCQTASPSGMACLPPVGSVDLCKFCTSGNDCSTGNCITTGTSNWCTRNCMSAADCGSGYDCVAGGSSMVCVPSGGTCPTPQCTSASQCAVGYACTNGMCVATGNVGDRCEISVYCKPCGSCILEPNGSTALCRSCCGGGAGTGSCKGCNTTTCPSAHTCFNVGGSTDQICYPNQGAGSCAACDAQTPCLTGYSCFQGRCHTPCNPTNPGACSACYATGAGGVCACPGQIAYTGQYCGQTSDGLKICTTGNRCVGNPATCRAQCNLADPASCPSGQACQSVDGVAVCMPANAPGQKCSACQANGTCGAGLICYNGRCYEQCNPDFASCNSCVAYAQGVGLCACEDQLAGPGQGCGVIGGDIYACAQGTTCTASGTCYLECQDDSHCPSPQTCGAGGVCEDYVWPAVDAGGGGGGGIVPPPGKPDAGSGGGSSFGGCGCTAGAGASGAWVLLGLMGLLARRRRRQAP